MTTTDSIQATSPAAGTKPPGTEHFPPFDLARLLKTVFNPRPAERVAILIDLDDPHGMKDLAFLQNPANTIQAHAYRDFQLALKDRILEQLDLRGGEMFCYAKTGGSNLDLPDLAVDVEGRELSLEKDIYPNYDLILCISTFSATAPLTAFAKKYGFRGATLHGVNPIILASGLAVNYAEVSKTAEKMRLGMTKADWVEIDFTCEGKKHTLHLDLNRQEAQKSHGLCLGGPDIANLPAGEIYFVPTGAHGEFPHRYEEGTLALMTVKAGRIVKSELIRGSAAVVQEHNEKLASDPVTGELGELGFGTQVLPVSGRDIQDEKVLGTFHVATGRSDHLGGTLTPDMFATKKNATHDDILFAPHKTPEIGASEVRLRRDGQTHVVIRNYEATDFIMNLRNAA